jgi:ATP-dependent DNA helicase DinG
VVTGELSELTVALAVRRVGRLIEQAIADQLMEAGEDLKALLAAAPPGRIDELPQVLGLTLALVRDSAGRCVTAMGPRGADKDDPDKAGQRKAAFSALDEVHDTAVRMLEAYGHASESDRAEVVWLDAGTDRRPPTLRVAPLTVSGMLRDKLFGERTVILTSATLALGGTFDALAAQWGLGDGKGWQGIDVGSPFDHPRAGILYVAKHLPQPGRDGLPQQYLDEITELIEAAGGRTLGLFSSMRAAKAATEALRERLDVPLLCQGDDSTMLLVKQFAEDEPTCLFGTLSLWQGVDVPGPSLRLVIIDRVPFPRPDDPLTSARQRHVAARGGNGFMAVAANHAALLLAQGAGRLLRAQDDKGVIAVLDPRLATARYSGFLLGSLPPFWRTTDPAIPRAALKRLASESPT